MDDGPAKLRALTDDYFGGLIERGHYLSERRALLDRLVGLPPEELEASDSDTTVPKNSAMDESIAIPTPASAAPPGKEPPVESASATMASAATTSVAPGPESENLTAQAADLRGDTDSANPPEVASGVASEEHLPARRVLLASVGAIIVVGLVGLFWFTGTDSDPVEVDNSSRLEMEDDRSKTIGESLVELEPEVISNLGSVEQFLTEPRWNETDVASFVFDWDMLSTAERESLRESELFTSFTNEVRNRIKVDRALGSTDFDNGMSISEAVSIELDLGLVEAVTELQSAVALPEDRPDEVLLESTHELAVKPDTRPPPAAPLSELVQDPAPPPPEQTAASGDAESVASSDAESVASGDAESVASSDAESVASIQAPVMPARPVSDRPCGVERLNYKSSTCWDMLPDDVKGPVLRVLPAGTFQMGQSNDKQASPVHEQDITVPFAIGTFEITVGQFEEYCAATGTPCPERRWAGPDFPVVDVTWQQAVAYTYWLSELTGSRYRLPTEVEWEYAARGGQSALYPFGDTISPTYARFDTGMKTLAPLPIVDRTTRYNGFRLWHVAGNVREWSADPWRENYSAEPDPEMRAVRGGSYAGSEDRLRSAARSGESVSYFDAKTGFRVVRELDLD